MKRIVDLNPTQTFRENPTYVAQFGDITVSSVFRAAVQTALLVYQQQLHSGQSPDEFAIQWAKMIGAREFVSVLIGLAEPASGQTRPRFAQPPNLNHNDATTQSPTTQRPAIQPTA